MHVIYTQVELQITQVTMFVKFLLNAPPLSRIKQSFQSFSEIMGLSSRGGGGDNIHASETSNALLHI